MFRSLSYGNCLLSSAFFSLVGNNSSGHELRVMAASKLLLIATYVQDPTLKSVYVKNQSVMIGKFFSFCRTGFKLGQRLRDSKKSDFNCSCEAPAQKKYWSYIMIRYFCIIFMCFIIIISFRKVHIAVLS